MFATATLISVADFESSGMINEVNWFYLIRHTVSGIYLHADSRIQLNVWISSNNIVENLKRSRCHRTPVCYIYSFFTKMLFGEISSLKGKTPVSKWEDIHLWKEQHQSLSGKRQNNSYYVGKRSFWKAKDELLKGKKILKGKTPPPKWEDIHFWKAKHQFVNGKASYF